MESDKSLISNVFVSTLDLEFRLPCLISTAVFRMLTNGAVKFYDKYILINTPKIIVIILDRNMDLLSVPLKIKALSVK